MQPILWSVLAIAGAFAVLFVAVNRARRRLPPIEVPAGETIPTTPLQRLALFSLAAVLAFSAGAAAVVVRAGAESAWNDDVVRLSATGLVLAAVAVYAHYGVRVGLWARRDGGILDERDRAILAAAPAGQAPAMLVTLAAWMIALIERFHATHQVPSPYLYLIFWSALLVSILALLAGVVIGYRRA
ncbi:MAG TPA: hypothetical protein VF139_04315 [Candidatus Polarisedimenticolaceae bacterium]